MLCLPFRSITLFPLLICQPSFIPWQKNNRPGEEIIFKIYRYLLRGGRNNSDKVKEFL